MDGDGQDTNMDGDGQNTNMDGAGYLGGGVESRLGIAIG